MEHKNNKVMKKNMETKFRCVFKALCANNQYRIGSIYFVGKTEEDAKEKTKKYLEKTYKNGFEIL